MLDPDSVGWSRRTRPFYRVAIEPFPNPTLSRFGYRFPVEPLNPPPRTADFRAIASRLERLARHLSPDAQPHIQATIRVLLAYADEADAATSAERAERAASKPKK